MHVPGQPSIAKTRAGGVALEDSLEYSRCASGRKCPEPMWFIDKATGDEKKKIKATTHNGHGLAVRRVRALQAGDGGKGCC